MAFGAAEAIELLPLGEVRRGGLEEREEKPHGDGIVDGVLHRFKRLRRTGERGTPLT
jgi:hypothetical protein